MGMLGRILGGTRRDACRPLYDAIVREARDPDWYRAGAVPDSFDGRFDVLATVLALVLLRLEAEDRAGAEAAARLTELFVADMDGQLRQRGVGDLVVGRHVGQMMGLLGGRLEAFRDEAGLPGAIARNLHRNAAVPVGAADAVAERLRALRARLAARPLAALIAGDL